jgi:hypothetical protein
VDEKEAIRVQMSPTMKQARSDINEEHKPDWRTLFRHQHQERYTFDREHKKAIHRIWYGAVSVRQMVREGKGFKALQAAFSGTMQRDILMMKQDRERAALSREIKKEIEERIAQVKEDFDRQFKDTRTRFLSDCDSLKSEQDESWDEIKSDWKEHNSERRESLSRGRGEERSQEQAQGLSQGRGRGLEPS